MARLPARWLPVVGFLLMVGVFWWWPPQTWSVPPPASTLTPAEATAVTDVVEGLVSDGALRMNVRLNQAWVAPATWASFDAHQKAHLTQTLATYCALKGDSARITVYDAQSARELAGVWGGTFYVK